METPITGEVPPPAKKSLARTIREVVSQKKRRFRKGEYDLDLSYITTRIIAMGEPNAGVVGRLCCPCVGGDANCAVEVSLSHSLPVWAWWASRRRGGVGICVIVHHVALSWRPPPSLAFLRSRMCM